jgi:alpha-tubulin suppressor-like RCC1 family protein
LIRCGWAALAAAVATTSCADVAGPPSDVRFVALAAGGAHTCALDGDGGAWCWGSNSHGQLGVGGRSGSIDTPGAVAGGRAYRELAAGQRHTCALDLEDHAWCWGANDSGQLGDDGFSARREPRRVALDRPLSRLASGGSHTCATDRAGWVWCWGRNEHGQVGTGPAAVQRPLRLEEAPRAGGIAAGGAHSCAVGSAGSFCWGANKDYQLGAATTRDTPLPVRVSVPTVLHALALGRAHSCGLTSGQGVACWGANERGQSGQGSGDAIGTAVPVAALQGAFAFIAAAPGGDRTCAAATSGVWCWGGREDPRLGPVVTLPTRVAGLPPGPLGGLAVGDAHACALVTGRISCWGDGASGQLGDGRRRFSEEPVFAGASAPR